MKTKKDEATTAAPASNDPQSDDAEEMLPEYDFSGGVRGKHAAALQSGYAIVIHHRDGTTTETTYSVGPRYLSSQNRWQKLSPLEVASSPVVPAPSVSSSS